jgi:hypothetical protein
MAHKVIVPQKNIMSRFLNSGTLIVIIYRRPTLYPLEIVPCCARDNLRGQKSLGPLKMSLEMAHKVILPPKKNYIPQFLKQRDINSY